MVIDNQYIALNNTYQILTFQQLVFNTRYFKEYSENLKYSENFELTENSKKYQLELEHMLVRTYYKHKQIVSRETIPLIILAYRGNMVI